MAKERPTVLRQKKRNGDEVDQSCNRKRKPPIRYLSADEEQNESIQDDTVVKFVKIMVGNGRIICLEVKDSDTVRKMKLKIQATEAIPFSQQELIFGNMVLDDAYTIADLGIDEESTFNLFKKSRSTMNIKINPISGGRTYYLEVKSSDTIGNVKRRLNNVEMLIFNETALDDCDTLADFNITDGSTLTSVDKHWGLMRIYVKDFTGKTISTSIKPTHTIADVKSNIKRQVKIPADEQVLIFDKMVLGDSGTLVDLRITGKSTLTVIRKSNVFTRFMQILVKTPTGETISLEVKPSDNIESIKALIEGKIHIPCDEQELIFNEMALHNMATLADLYINTESVLTLMRISTGFMHICIKYLTGKAITLKVKPSTTIHHVKSMIHDKEGWPPLHQRLVFDGKPLYDNATLDDYNIHKDSNVHLIVRM